MNGQILEAGATRALEVKAQGEREIVLTRSFEAPRALVWEALSRPEHLRRWWGACDGGLTIDTMDFREGGNWRFLTSGSHGEHGFRGQYREIVPQQKLVQTFEWEGMPGHVSLETLTLDERDGQTMMMIHCFFDTQEDRDGMLASNMEEGAGGSYDLLEKLLHELAAS